MKNRAKCRLCNDIIESKDRHDYVRCSCYQIAVDGGNDYWKCSAKDWANFIRIDDEGNEIIPKIIDKEPEVDVVESNKETVENTDNVRKLNKEEILEELNRMIMRYEELPDMAMISPITHYDHLSLMMLISALFEANDEAKD